MANLKAQHYVVPVVDSTAETPAAPPPVDMIPSTKEVAMFKKYYKIDRDGDTYLISHRNRAYHKDYEKPRESITTIMIIEGWNDDGMKSKPAVPDPDTHRPSLANVEIFEWDDSYDHPKNKFWCPPKTDRNDCGNNYKYYGVLKPEMVRIHCDICGAC